MLILQGPGEDGQPFHPAGIGRYWARGCAGTGREVRSKNSDMNLGKQATKRGQGFASDPDGTVLPGPGIFAPPAFPVENLTKCMITLPPAFPVENLTKCMIILV